MIFLRISPRSDSWWLMGQVQRREGKPEYSDLAGGLPLSGRAPGFSTICACFAAPPRGWSVVAVCPHSLITGRRNSSCLGSAGEPAQAQEAPRMEQEAGVHMCTPNPHPLRGVRDGKNISKKAPGWVPKAGHWLEGAGIRFRICGCLLPPTHLWAETHGCFVLSSTVTYLRGSVDCGMWVVFYYKSESNRNV